MAGQDATWHGPVWPGAAWLFYPRYGPTRPGWVWRGSVRQDTAFPTLDPARRGLARRVMAGRGLAPLLMARHGKGFPAARPGKTRLGVAGHGLARLSYLRPGTAWRGLARLGTARFGKAGLGHG